MWLPLSRKQANLHIQCNWHSNVLPREVSSLISLSAHCLGVSPSSMLPLTPAQWPCSCWRVICKLSRFTYEIWQWWVGWLPSLTLKCVHFGASLEQQHLALIFNKCSDNFTHLYKSCTNKTKNFNLSAAWMLIPSQVGGGADIVTKYVLYNIICSRFKNS